MKRCETAQAVGRCKSFVKILHPVNTGVKKSFNQPVGDKHGPHALLSHGSLSYFPPRTKLSFYSRKP